MKENKSYRLYSETIEKLEKRKKERGVSFDKLFELMMKALDIIENNQ